MREHAVAVRLGGRGVLQSVRWCRRAVPAALCLAVAALFVQGPGSRVAGLSAKADPALSTLAAAHPAQVFPGILRETTPASTAAADLGRSLGGHVSRAVPMR